MHSLSEEFVWFGNQNIFNLINFFNTGISILCNKYTKLLISQDLSIVGPRDSCLILNSQK